MSDDQTPAATPADGQAETDVNPIDGWLAEQPEEVQTMIADYTHGLKSALERQKADRKALREKLDNIAKQGADAEAQVSAIREQVSLAEKRARFFESLPASVADKRLAWVAAKEYEAMNEDGSANIEKLRESVPSVFQQSKLPSAGSGTNAPPTAVGINEIIRMKARIN